MLRSGLVFYSGAFILTFCTICKTPGAAKLSQITIFTANTNLFRAAYRAHPLRKGLFVQQQQQQQDDYLMIYWEHQPILSRKYRAHSFRKGLFVQQQQDDYLMIYWERQHIVRSIGSPPSEKGFLQLFLLLLLLSKIIIFSKMIIFTGNTSPILFTHIGPSLSKENNFTNSRNLSIAISAFVIYSNMSETLFYLKVQCTKWFSFSSTIQCHKSHILDISDCKLTDQHICEFILSCYFDDFSPFSFVHISSVT